MTKQVKEEFVIWSHRQSSRYSTPRVIPLDNNNPHRAGVTQAFVKPSDQKKAQSSERRVHLWVISNIIGILLTMGLVWLITK